MLVITDEDAHGVIDYVLKERVEVEIRTYRTNAHASDKTIRLMHELAQQKGVTIQPTTYRPPRDQLLVQPPEDGDTAALVSA